MILHLPQNTPEWHAHRAEVLPDGPAVGGSDLWRWLGLDSFTSASPAERTATPGHILEPLILLRLADVLDVAPFERDWCAVDDAHPWMRGSLDGLIRGPAGAPELMADAKAVLLGSAAQWRPTGSGDPLDGCPAHVRYQMLWYVGIVGVPLYVAALMIPSYSLDGDPVRIALCSEMRLYRFDPVEHATEIAELRATITALRAAGRAPAVTPSTPPPPPPRAPVLPGSLADGQAIARWLDLRERRRRAESAEQAARATVASLIPPHARGITAGGYTVTRDARGALRVQE